MSILFASTLAWSYPIRTVLDMAAEEQWDGVEIWSEHVWRFNEKPEDIHEKLKQLNLTATLHASSWDLNLCALNEGIRKQSVQEVRHSIDLAAQLGADNVTFHPGRLTLPDLAHSLHEDLLTASLEVITEYAMQKDIVVSMEIMEQKPKEFVTNAHVMNRIIEGFPPYLQTTFDVAHMPLDIDSRSVWEELNQVGKIHISDATEQTLHLPLGEGKIEKETLSYFLQNDCIPVVVEGLDQSKDLNWLQKNLQYIRENTPFLQRRTKIEHLSNQ
ncbi:sugar phosphate isomerase/epimerase family protein [Virgibacillus xinjiangensis]|uniref:Sugar phosphate isomerase/epimerase family protein n=1 Tax=Virgibacillus xinjiangensis TaxID=393090 RepID=A0ABV7CWM5_9BACI